MTVQRAAALSQLVEADDQLVTPPSVIKIVTGDDHDDDWCDDDNDHGDYDDDRNLLLLLLPGQGPSPGDVQSMLKKLPYIALYITRCFLPYDVVGGGITWWW